jgi:hypothetical protein
MRWLLNHPSFRHISYLVALSICIYLLVDAMLGVMFGAVNAQPSRTVAAAPLANLQNSLDTPRNFPDFGYMLAPEAYQGRVFHLRQDYPLRPPVLDADVQALLAIDLYADRAAYGAALRDYLLAGNIERPDVANDFFLEDNLLRDWYHVPWQHWGPSGREGFHGLTQAAPIAAYLATPVQSASHTYAVDFYNDQGGYVIGQIWQNPTAPDLDYLAEGNPFPVGTVMGRMIFTTLDAETIPALVDPIEWTAYVYACDLPQATVTVCDERRPAPVRLLQLEVMVRDPQAGAEGWNLVTFAYDGTQGHAERWENLTLVEQSAQSSSGATMAHALNLHLNLGIENFMQFQKQTAQGIYGVDYESKGRQLRRNLGN